MVLLRDSLSLLPLALPLLSLPLAAADDCQPVTWTKIRNKARDVATGAAASPPAATELAAAADFQVPGTHEPYLVRRDPATIQPGDFVCRLWIESDEEVNYWTCSDMAARFQLTREQFFEMNPNLLPDCSNIEPETDYCVRGYIEPIRSSDGNCGPQFPGVTCSGTAAQCCNAETWTCGATEEDCSPGICYEGACPGHNVLTTDGTCGAQNGGRQCAGKWGECCNQSGVCGNGTAFCGETVCQSGKCAWKPSPTSSSSTVISSSTSTTTSSTTSTSSSAAPTVTNCNFGTGPGGYLGLCEYSCTFGFCPPPCTCTSPGTPVPAPALTGDSGYAVLNLPEDFGPLCHFTVSHGYIATDVCTNIPYTTSPGGPGTGCVRGVGTGEYTGLCDFCCSFDYCPEVCTCTLYGRLNNKPPSLSTPGVPTAGHDASFTGLCSFACDHNYCPPDQCEYA